MNEVVPEKNREVSKEESVAGLDDERRRIGARWSLEDAEEPENADQRRDDTQDQGKLSYFPEPLPFLKVHTSERSCWFF